MIITIGGDVCVTDGNREMFANKETDKLFNDVKDVFSKSDINFVNLECAITDSENRIKKFGPNLKAPKGTASVLKEVGIDYCSLSNNHTFDFGIEGLKDTINALNEQNIVYTGVGEDNIDARKDLIIEKGGKKIAIIAVCEHEYSYALTDRTGAREYDPYDTTEDIIEAKKTADYVIVIYHGGKEMCRYPSPRLIKLCHSMANHGADVVLCQHSHCIGCYENYNNCHIMYGQGNFHFTKLNDNETEMWSTGLLLQFDTENKESIKFIPTYALNGGIHIAKDDFKNKIISELDKRNKELENGEWKKGWHEFCESVKETYTNAITSGDMDFFAHYLDCEAHTDVWRELYPTWNMTNEK
ncbi:MAG: CapA family protein [Clostridia bacterium]|nr:CapA family protein [Clostridia bacterium]